MSCTHDTTHTFTHTHHTHTIQSVSTSESTVHQLLPWCSHSPLSVVQSNPSRQPTQKMRNPLFACVAIAAVCVAVAAGKDTSQQCVVDGSVHPVDSPCHSDVESTPGPSSASTTTTLQLPTSLLWTVFYPVMLSLPVALYVCAAPPARLCAEPVGFVASLRRPLMPGFCVATLTYTAAG